MDRIRWLNEAKSALLLSRKPGVGAAAFRYLIEQWRWPSLALEAWQDQEEHKHIRKKASLNLAITQALEWLQHHSESHSLVWFNGPWYPKQLADLSEPPPVLFVKGSLDSLQKAMVAIVGPRTAHVESERLTSEIANYCIDVGLTLVSGGAKGIDAAVHRQAIARQVSTIAVLGTGVDVVYPREHELLFQSIVSQGALVSELLPGTQPRASFFPTRNRILAAFASAVIIVHAYPKSGSVITARWAQKLSRPFAWVNPQEQFMKQLATHQEDIVCTAEETFAWLQQKFHQQHSHKKFCSTVI